MKINPQTAFASEALTTAIAILNNGIEDIEMEPHGEGLHYSIFGHKVEASDRFEVMIAEIHGDPFAKDNNKFYPLAIIHREPDDEETKVRFRRFGDDDANLSAQAHLILDAFDAILGIQREAVPTSE